MRPRWPHFSGVSTNDVHRTIDAVWRIESARLIAGVARMVGDIGIAEDLAQDALVAALEQDEVEYIFGVPGEENLDLFERMKRGEFPDGSRVPTGTPHQPGIHNERQGS